MEAKAHAHGIADFGIRSVSRLDKLSARVFAATDDERIAALWDSKTPWEQREALHGCWGEDFEP
jgi:imidazolonepropionase-like amidohydrolase